MLRFSLSIVIVSGVVLSGGGDNFNPQNHQEFISGGIVIPSSDKAHSFYHKSIPCNNVEKWKEEYEKLKQKDAPLPQILQNFDISSAKPKCEIFLKNLFTLDMKIYWNIDLLIASFLKLLSALEKDSNYKVFDINVGSFAYEPSTRRFVFLDLENLKTTSQKNEVATFRKEMAEKLFESLVHEDLPLTDSNIEVFKSLKVNIKNYDGLLNPSAQIRTITLRDKIDIKTGAFDTSSVKVFINNKGSHYEIIVQEPDKTTAIKEMKKEDPFMIYICQQMNNQGDFECSNIDIKNLDSNFFKEYSIASNRRIDVEIQETFTQQNNWNTDKKRAFYEIFLFINPKTSAGFAESITFNTINNPIEIKDNDLILIETLYKNLIVYYTQNGEPKMNTFQMNSKALEIKNLKELVQISPFLLEKKSILDSDQVKRIFYVSQGAKKAIFSRENLSDRVKLISFENSEIGPGPLILNECKNPFSHFYFTGNSESMTVDHHTYKKKYPGPVTFKAGSSLTDKVLKICFKTYLKNLFFLSFESNTFKESHFRWNFNSQEKAIGDNSKENIIYLYNTPIAYNRGYVYNEFAWPIPNPYVVFVSIIKSFSDPSYICRGVFYKENKKLYKIHSPKKALMSFAELPEKLQVNEGGSFWSTRKNTHKFNNLNAVYLNDNEIVYQLEIPNFKNCRPLLKLDEKDTLRIYCESEIGVCTHPEELNEKDYTKGLERVAAQAVPITSGEQQNSSISDSNKVIGLLVLI